VAAAVELRMVNTAAAVAALVGWSTQPEWYLLQPPLTPLLLGLVAQAEAEDRAQLLVAIQRSN
jgi:hypothetical protein